MELADHRMYHLVRLLRGFWVDRSGVLKPLFDQLELVHESLGLTQAYATDQMHLVSYRVFWKHVHKHVTPEWLEALHAADVVRSMHRSAIGL